MKVLALGFSVTEQYPGYVGVIAEKYKNDPELEIIRVGLGGLQHYHARYLFPDIISKHKPDIIIIDHATPAFRNWTSEYSDYKNSLKSLLRECYEHSIKVLLIDFPRKDVDYSNDWVTNYHLEVSKALSIPYKLLPLKDGILKDEVHATELGHIYYAEEILLLIKEAVLITEPGLLFNELPRYKSVFAGDISKSNNEEITFSRGGLSGEFIRVRENEEMIFDFGMNTVIKGYTCLLGPQSGFLNVKINGEVTNYLHYDQFCYYQRMHGKVFPSKIISSQLSIKQTAEIPDVVLLKGEKNVQERSGFIGHIFIEEK